MTVRAVNGAEALILVSTSIGSIGRGDEDDIALIPLHIFEILNEECILPAFHPLLVGNGEWLLPQTSVEQLFHQLSLFEVQRNNAERFIRMLVHVFENGIHYHVRLAWVPAVLKNAA